MRHSTTAVLMSLMLVFLAFAGGRETSLASSIPFIVDNTSDAPDIAPGNGVCETGAGNGVCTLRAAIDEGNATTGAVTITLPSGHYVLSQGELFVSGALTIDGAGAATTTVDGNSQARVFFIAQGADAGIFGLTITGGDSDEDGGGIFNIGTLAVNESIIRDNSAYRGGGVASETANARLMIDRTAITDNEADNGGGGIFLSDPGSQATITNTEISHNSSSVFTGGVHTQSGVIATFTNVTISDNTSPPPAFIVTGGPDTTTEVTLTNVTIAGNTHPESGGAAFVYSSARLTLKNSIVQDDGLACSGDGTFTSLGHNIDGDGSCQLTGPGDLPSTDPLLGPLADNGGPTQTRALLAGSPAIDAGDNDGCPSTDQRGIARPADGDGDSTAVCDIGAFEVQGPFVLTQGDVNCDGNVNQADFDFLLRFAAGLNDGTTPGDCPDLGQATIAAVIVFPWGDVNCDSAVDAVDTLYVLAHTVDIELPPVAPSCVDIGEPLT